MEAPRPWHSVSAPAAHRDTGGLQAPLSQACSPLTRKAPVYLEILHPCVYDALDSLMATVGSKVFFSLDSGPQPISPATTSFTWADTTPARRVAPSPSVNPSPSKEQRVFGHVGILRVEASQRGVLHRVQDCLPHSSPSPLPSLCPGAQQQAQRRPESCSHH